MAKRRRSLGYTAITATVEVDVDDIVADLSNEELSEIVRSRNIQSSLGCDTSDAENALFYLRSGDIGEAILLLERALYPKFSTTEACKAKLEALISGAALANVEARR